MPQFQGAWVRQVALALIAAAAWAGRAGTAAALAAEPQATPQATPEDTLARIQRTQVITIGHRLESVPLSYVAGERVLGYSVDLCRHLAAAIAQELQLKAWRIAYRPVTSATRFDAVEKGEIDLECGSTTNTAARRERVAFTIPHFIASSRLMVRADRPHERIEDLDGATVASTAGSTNVGSLAREAVLKGLKLKVVEAADHAQGVAWVLSGRVEAFAMDDVLLYGLRASAAKPEALKVIGKPITIEPYAIAFQRDNPRLKRLADAALRQLIASRELHRLYDRWFVEPIPPHNVRLDMRMPHLLADSLKYPSDFVPK